MNHSRTFLKHLLPLLLLVLPFTSTTSAQAQAPTQPSTSTVKPALSALERELRKVCPSQPGVMYRKRCIQWVQVGQCETGHQQRRVTLASLRAVRWRYNGGSGFDGALQFRPSTWTSNVWRIPSRQLTRHQRLQRKAGGYHHAWSAPPAVQILASEVLRKRPDSSGLGNWPTCGAWF